MNEVNTDSLCRYGTKRTLTRVFPIIRWERCQQTRVALLMYEVSTDVSIAGLLRAMAGLLYQSQLV